MTQSEYKARQVRAKTNEVFEYDHDDEKPGKPLHILIPGGLIALATLALIIFIGYLTWFDESLSQEIGVVLLIILAPFYVGGVFLFSYGYELYNIPRAIRLTAIIARICKRKQYRHMEGAAIPQWRWRHNGRVWFLLRGLKFNRC